MRIGTCLLLGLFALACEPAADYQVIVEVAGDAGLAFSGYCSTTYGVDSVSGTVPDSWTVPVGRDCGDALLVCLRKSNQPGTMIVRLIVEGDTVREDSLTAPSGELNLSWQPGG